MFLKDSKYYREIEHTADIGLQIHGESLIHLFANAAFGFYDLILGEHKNSEQDRKKIQLNAANVNDLMVNWLSELNYLLSVDHFVAASFIDLQIISEESEVRLNAELVGESNSDFKQNLGFEIKAITYHQLNIHETVEGYKTDIFFDI